MTPALPVPSFEQGPIRPPSEAYSLLVRVIRNCTWNRCTFCPVYKGAKSSQRPLEDVLADVEAMAAAAAVLRADGRGALHGGRLPQEAFQVMFFLHGGERHVFLQDADPLAVKPDKLAAVVARVRDPDRRAGDDLRPGLDARPQDRSAARPVARSGPHARPPRPRVGRRRGAYGDRQGLHVG